MKKSVALAMSFAVVAVSGMTLGAQSESKKPNQTVPDTITVIGCVDRADQLSAATPDTTADSLSFVLTHASRDGEAASSKPTAENRGAEREPGSMYRLDGSLTTLNPHVGHKVQVTGRVVPTATGTAGATDPASAANAPRLKVDTIKMLAETCAR
jgi:hypothetical protein